MKNKVEICFAVLKTCINVRVIMSEHQLASIFIIIIIIVIIIIFISATIIIILLLFFIFIILNHYYNTLSLIVFSCRF